MTTGILAGKVALITGAAGGIGRASAIAFAREGAKVMVADINEAGGLETRQLIRDAGGEAEFMACRVDIEEQVAVLVQRTVDTFGSLDCAFNNAGISTTATELKIDAFRRTVDINLMGVVHGMKYELEQMLKQGGGTIVNTGSIAGLTGNGTLDYCASKHAVVGVTRSAALHYASRGIRVNAVCPGVIETAMVTELMPDPKMKARIVGMMPMGRMGQPEEIAEAALWLSSPKSSFVTGQAIAVDGGLMCR